MSVQQIMDVLLKYGTFEQTPEQTQHAYEELQGYSKGDTTHAFAKALSSGNKDLVLFTLTLIADFFADCTDVLPEVRYCLINGSRLEQAAAMTALSEMKDADKTVEQALRQLMASGDRLMQIAAAGTLLHCFACSDARRFLEQRRDDEDALWHLQRQSF
jgi:hypothetical protein